MSYAESRAGQIDSSRLIFPGLAGLYESIAPYSYSIIRFVAGAILVFHGYGKLFGGNIQGVADHVATPLGLPMPAAIFFRGGGRLSVDRMIGKEF
jgi:putative oxidoreductase